MVDNADLPPVVYLPCVPDSGSGEPRLALQRTQDGRLALMVYTALDRLRRSVGDDSQWVLLKTEGLGALRSLNPFDVLLVDQEVPPEARTLESA